MEECSGESEKDTNFTGSWPVVVQSGMAKVKEVEAGTLAGASGRERPREMAQPQPP